MKNTNLLTAAALFLGLITFLPVNAHARTAAEIDREARGVLRQLVARDSGARSLSRRAYAVLVFPSIVKGGFILAGQHGTGALIRAKDERWLLQNNSGLVWSAGRHQKLATPCFMNRESSALPREGGVGITALGHRDRGQGKSGSLSTTKLTKGIYTVFFNEKGLMGGPGALEDYELTRLSPGATGSK